MQLRHLQAAIAILLWLGQAPVTNAHTTAVALTGDDAIGVPSAKWDQLFHITLNEVGSVAFRASLQHEEGIVEGNDRGVWLFDSDGKHLLARTGVGNVPEVPSADFAGFSPPALSDTGEVLFSGSLSSAGGVSSDNDRGIWRYNSTGESLVAREGSGDVPEISNANFTDFFAAPGSLADNGDLVLAGILEVGVGGVTNLSDRGIWSYTSNGPALIAREGSFDVPGLPGIAFSNFGIPDNNSNNQFVAVASLKFGGAVTSSNSLGVWRYTGSNGELLARNGVGNVPGQPGHSFVGFEEHRINDAGQVAIAAVLNDTQLSEGIWLYDGPAGQQVASETSNVPEMPDARFEGFNLRSINNAGQILTSSILELGVGGVTSGNDRGLWIVNGEESLIARSGSGNVPGVPNASFESFTNGTLNESGQVAFTAKLAIGGDIDASNRFGIWFVDPVGKSSLVAREGEQLMGRTVDSLFFIGDANDGRTSGFNDRGEIAFQASFTSGESGVFLFRPVTADFDGDSEVGSGDLSAWQAAYSVAENADADLDDDSDGADFLVWQREFGSSGAGLPIVSEVPEPAGFSMLVLAALGVGTANRRNYPRH